MSDKNPDIERQPACAGICSTYDAKMRRLQAEQDELGERRLALLEQDPVKLGKLESIDVMGWVIEGERERFEQAPLAGDCQVQIEEPGLILRGVCRLRGVTAPTKYICTNPVGQFK